MNFDPEKLQGFSVFAEERQMGLSQAGGAAGACAGEFLTLCSVFRVHTMSWSSPKGEEYEMTR